MVFGLLGVIFFFFVCSGSIIVWWFYDGVVFFVIFRRLDFCRGKKLVELINKEVFMRICILLVYLKLKE